MDERTVRSLSALDDRFYREAAAEFDATRQAPWAGWTRLLPSLTERAQRTGAGEGLRVLDVGCGNGRFAAFLAASEVKVARYVGIDRSEALLARAREHDLGGFDSVQFVKGDLLDAGMGGLDGVEPGARFDVVALFGLLHHVPGFTRRRALLRTCAARLSPVGIVVATLWRFLGESRTASRVVPWSECAARTGIEIGEGEIEPGDSLVAFGVDPGHVRYAHDFDATESALLSAGLPLRALDSFEADGASGRANLYLVLAREVDQVERSSSTPGANHDRADEAGGT